MTLYAYIVASALLTGNRQGAIFAESMPRLETKATLEVSLDVPQQMRATALDRHGVSALLNGRIDGDGGSSVWGPWGGPEDAFSFTIDLQDTYLIEKAALWSCEDEGARGIDWYSLSVGVNSTGLTEVVRRRVLPAELSPTRKVPIAIACMLQRPVAARYVRVDVKRNPRRHQMVIGEFALWGRVLEEDCAVAEFSAEAARAPVDFSIDGFSSGAAWIDWSRFDAPGEVREWRIYMHDRPFSDVRDSGAVQIGTTPGSERSFLIAPLPCNVERHYGVTAVYHDGECPKVSSMAHRPLGPLEVRRFADVFGFNFYWGGGSANEGNIPDSWYSVAADFISRGPFRRIRWWRAPASFVEKQFVPRRIEVSNRCDEIDVCRRNGIYLHYFSNEPELREGMTPEKNVAYMREQRRKWNAAGAGHVFYGPVVGIDERGFDFFRGFIEAGGADCVDAFDFHTYCGKEREFRYPANYPWGSPETIIDRVNLIRGYLAEKGIDKPLTASEWGYSDTQVMNTHMESPSPLRKAQFLVRGCMIHHRIGFRRVFLYSFFDEGVDPTCSESLYGVVSRDLQKKPAYHALEVMARVLGDTLFERESESKAESGDFGYVFRRADGGGFVTSLWNGAGERSVRLRTPCESVEVVTMFGETHRQAVSPKGEFRLSIGPSPIYVKGTAAVDFVNEQEVENE